MPNVSGLIIHRYSDPATCLEENGEEGSVAPSETGTLSSSAPNGLFVSVNSYGNPFLVLVSLHSAPLTGTIGGGGAGAAEFDPNTSLRLQRKNKLNSG